MVKQQQTILAGSLMGALVFVAVAMWFVLGSRDGAAEPPSVMLLGVLVAAGVAVHVLHETTGYRTAALPAGLAGEEARRQALLGYQSAMFRRFAASEAVAMVSIVLAFLVESGGFVLVLVGCAVSLVLMAVHVWPSRRVVDKTAASLEREGADSRLHEAFGMPPGLGGAIREL